MKRKARKRASREFGSSEIGWSPTLAAAVREYRSVGCHLGDFAAIHERVGGTVVDTPAAFSRGVLYGEGGVPPSLVSLRKPNPGLDDARFTAADLKRIRAAAARIRRAVDEGGDYDYGEVRTSRGVAYVEPDEDSFANSIFVHVGDATYKVVDVPARRRKANPKRRGGSRPGFETKRLRRAKRKAAKHGLVLRGAELRTAAFPPHGVLSDPLAQRARAYEEGRRLLQEPHGAGTLAWARRMATFDPRTGRTGIDLSGSGRFMAQPRLRLPNPKRRAKR